MLSNKQIAVQLEKVIENSKVEVPVMGNVCGFPVVNRWDTKVHGKVPQDRLEALISILKED